MIKSMFMSTVGVIVSLVLTLPVWAITNSASNMDATATPSVGDASTHYPLSANPDFQTIRSYKYCCSIGLDYNRIYYSTNIVYPNNYRGGVNYSPQSFVHDGTGFRSFQFGNARGGPLTGAGGLSKGASNYVTNFLYSGVTLACRPGYVMTAKRHVDQDIVLTNPGTLSTRSYETAQVDIITCAPIAIKCAWVSPDNINAANKLSKNLKFSRQTPNNATTGSAVLNPLERTRNSIFEYTLSTSNNDYPSGGAWFNSTPAQYHPEYSGYNMCYDSQ